MTNIMVESLAQYVYDCLLRPCFPEGQCILRCRTSTLALLGLSGVTPAGGNTPSALGESAPSVWGNMAPSSPSSSSSPLPRHLGTPAGSHAMSYGASSLQGSTLRATKLNSPIFSIYSPFVKCFFSHVCPQSCRPQRRIGKRARAEGHDQGIVQRL